MLEFLELQACTSDYYIKPLDVQHKTLIVHDTGLVHAQVKIATC